MSKSLSEIAAQYREAPSASTEYNRVLLYGGAGTGKTYSLRTFRLPLMVDSFDPGGSICLSDYVAEGKALVRSAYEKEDWDKPTAFDAWCRDFDSAHSAGIFSQVGTYCLDSATTWAQAAMNVVLKKAGRAGQVPQQNDWYPQMIMLEKALRKIMDLPCDVVFIFHEDTEKDEILGSLKRGILATGKLKTRIPILFSEFYYAKTQRTSKGTEYMWQTQSDSQLYARSRNASIAKVKIDATEPADFRKLAIKWGGLAPDLPLIEVKK